MTVRSFSKALPLVIALSLAACSHSETGSDLPAADFGNATMNNGLIQSGELNYVMALGTRFAQEVPSTITFAFNSAELDGAARAVLSRQAHWIRQFPEVRFKVYGHTDAVGSSAYNYRLGLRRAQAVVAFLASQGVSRARLEAVVSHGKTQPAIPVPGPERANRRTVTEVTGFVARHPTVLNGKYAEVIFRDYVRSAGGATTTPATSVSGG